MTHPIQFRRLGGGTRNIVEMWTGDTHHCFFCAAVVPDSTVANVLAFACAVNWRHNSGAWLQMSDLSRRVQRILDACYGQHGERPAGDMVRLWGYGARINERHEIAEIIAEHLGVDYESFLAMMSCWMLAWAMEEVRFGVVDQAEDADLFAGDVKIDVDSLWKRAAYDLQARLSALGLTVGPVEATA